MSSVRVKKSIVKKISITNIIIFSLACILSIAATVVLNVQYHIRRDAEMMNVYISNAMNSVDNTLKDMGRVSLICFSDQGIQEILKNTESYSMAEELENEEYMKDLYSSMISIRDDVKGIYIFDRNEMIFYSDRSTPSLRMNYDVSAFFEEVREKSELNTNISGCHMYLGTLPEGFHYTGTFTEETLESHNIYLVRPIRSFSPYEVIGYIAIRTPIRTMKKICDEFLDKEVSYLLADEYGTIACSSALEGVGESIAEDFPEIESRLTGDKGSFFAEYHGQKCMVCYQKSEYSDMVIVTTKPLWTIFLEMKTLLIWCFLVAILCLAIVLVSVSVMTGKNMKRVTDFARELRDFKPTDLSKRYQIEEMDEVGVLKDSFNKMIASLDQAVIAEYKARVQLQQAEISEQKMAMMYLKQQINPHFLYNTLDVIRLKAAMNKDTEVSEMLMKLVSFYRLSTRVDSQYVSIRQEVEMLNAYMALMCYRYRNLRYHTEIEDSTWKMEIPNFTLQPLLENSLLHGLKDRRYEGNIWLKVFCQEEQELHIQVVDDGVGLSEEMRTRLNSYNEIEGLHVEEQQEQEKHVGVWNVILRLRLYYQERCTMQYSRNERGETCVEIVIKNAGGKKDENT